jgi:Domain of unknown function (DUF4411)
VTASRQFLLDTSVLIEAQRQGYYALQTCPGFWDCLQWHLGEGRCRIITEVRAELTKEDDIVRWLDSTLDGSALPSAMADQAAVNAYRDVAEWVTNEWPEGRRRWLLARNPSVNPDKFRRKTEPEIAKFLGPKCADPWVIAYAKANGVTVVTEETVATAKRWYVVKIPDVCSALSVDCCTVPEMLQALGVSFSWSPRGDGSYPQSPLPMGA